MASPAGVDALGALPRMHEKPRSQTHTRKPRGIARTLPLLHSTAGITPLDTSTQRTVTRRRDPVRRPGAGTAFARSCKRRRRDESAMLLSMYWTAAFPHEQPTAAKRLPWATHTNPRTRPESAPRPRPRGAIKPVGATRPGSTKRQQSAAARGMAPEDQSSPLYYEQGSGNGQPRHIWRGQGRGSWNVRGRGIQRKFRFT
jgi:hypothetical protein